MNSIKVYYISAIVSLVIDQGRIAIFSHHEHNKIINPLILMRSTHEIMDDILHSDLVAVLTARM